jgi:hypothetical protein
MDGTGSRFPTNHYLEYSIESLASFTHRLFFLCSDGVACMPSPLCPDDLNWGLEKSELFIRSPELVIALGVAGAHTSTKQNNEAGARFRRPEIARLLFCFWSTQ